LVGAPGVTGIGLANIRERLALQYGEHAVLETASNNPRGFVARPVLPLDPVPVRATTASLTESAAQ
jgi:sensor histidine kinase YesM